MYCLPFETYTIDSPLPPDEAIAQLEDSIETLYFFDLGVVKHRWLTKPLAGSVRGRRFRIMRSSRSGFPIGPDLFPEIVPQFQLGLWPTLYGKVEPFDAGSRLRVLYRTHDAFVFLYLIFVPAAIWSLAAEGDLLFRSLGLLALAVTHVISQVLYLEDRKKLRQGLEQIVERSPPASDG